MKLHCLTKPELDQFPALNQNSPSNQPQTLEQPDPDTAHYNEIQKKRKLVKRKKPPKMLSEFERMLKLYSTEKEFKNYLLQQKHRQKTTRIIQSKPAPDALKIKNFPKIEDEDNPTKLSVEVDRLLDM